MSQLSIGIGVKLDMAKASVEEAGESYVEFSEFTPDAGSYNLDTLADWTKVIGMSSIRNDIGAVYAFATGNGGAVWDTPVAVTSPDQWMQYVVGLQHGTVEMGVAVRMSAVEETFYGLWTNSTKWYLLRALDGAVTNLDEGVITTLAGDIFRLEVEGTALTAYRNGVEIGSAVDANIATGQIGLVCDGLSASAKITRIRGGDLPIGNLPVNNGFVAAAYNQGSENIASVTDSCFANDSTLFDVSKSVQSHLVDHVHYIDLDFVENRVFSKTRIYAQNSDTGDMTDVTIKTKLLSGDAWTTVAANVAFDGAGFTDWHTSPTFDIIQAARYVRIEVNATAHANNWLQVYEVEMYSQGQI